MRSVHAGREACGARGEALHASVTSCAVEVARAGEGALSVLRIALVRQTGRVGRAGDGRGAGDRKLLAGGLPRLGVGAGLRLRVLARLWLRLRVLSLLGIALLRVLTRLSRRVSASGRRRIIVLAGGENDERSDSNVDEVAHEKTFLEGAATVCRKTSEPLDIRQLNPPSTETTAANLSLQSQWSVVVDGCAMNTWVRWVVAAVVCGGCTHKDPPGPLGAPSAAPIATSATVTAGAAANAAPSASAPAGTGTASPLVGDASAGDVGEQTRDMPSSESAAFNARATALFRAIQTNDAAVARDAFFPVGAYEKVKAIASPRSDWEHRLMAAFGRDIATLHKRHGDAWSEAKLVSVDVPRAAARWMNPGEEGNKLGYYRVYGTSISYDLKGATHKIDVKSLISWRGEWYVVHLLGFK